MNAAGRARSLTASCFSLPAFLGAALLSMAHAAPATAGESDQWSERASLDAGDVDSKRLLRSKAIVGAQSAGTAAQSSLDSLHLLFKDLPGAQALMQTLATYPIGTLQRLAEACAKYPQAIPYIARFATAEAFTNPRLMNNRTGTAAVLDHFGDPATVGPAQARLLSVIGAAGQTAAMATAATHRRLLNNTLENILISKVNIGLYSGEGAAFTPAPTQVDGRDWIMLNYNEAKCPDELGTEMLAHEINHLTRRLPAEATAAYFKDEYQAYLVGRHARNGNLPSKAEMLEIVFDQILISPQYPFADLLARYFTGLGSNAEYMESRAILDFLREQFGVGLAPMPGAVPPYTANIPPLSGAARPVAGHDATNAPGKIRS
jgi:hypothetical protein